MTTVEAASAPSSVPVEAGAVHLSLGGQPVVLHPLWLLSHSCDSADVDPTSRQRVVGSGGSLAELHVLSAFVDETTLAVWFSDGQQRHFALDELRNRVAGMDPEAVPKPVPWTHLDMIPTIDWSAVVAHDRAALVDVLGDFHRLGCFVITGAPTKPGSLHGIAGRFGRVAPTNFGALFDVESVPDPVDLAYTPVGLSPHTDQPYRNPTPGLQFLHTLSNNAPGGESTVVDGLAAIDALRRVDPGGYELLCDLEVEFRYDIGHDVKVDRAPLIDVRRDGTLRQLRFSPRLDFAPHADVATLDCFYRARRWLAQWFDDHEIEFKMLAGDVLIVDNHRVLHGRRPFDQTVGRRHLQGCYIDHDGPATMWRLLTRGVERT